MVCITHSYILAGGTYSLKNDRIKAQKKVQAGEGRKRLDSQK